MRIFFSLFHYLLLLIIYITRIIINANITEKYPSNRKLSYSNEVNDLINIYASNEKIGYISSAKNEYGSIYIMINTIESDSSLRLLYIINPDNTIDNRTMIINSPIHNKYPLMTTLIINKIEYIATISHEGTQFELIDFIQDNIYTCSLYKVLTYNSFILKNAFTSLNYYKNSNYVLNAYIDKHGSNFLIQKLNFRHYNISKYKILSTEKKVGLGFTNSTVSCFEIENYVECLYTNSNLLYTVSVFNIETLDNIYNEIIEAKPITDNELFSKGIHIKKNVGAFFYFTSSAQILVVQFKIFISSENEYKLNDYIESININKNGYFPLTTNYIYNDIIKTCENNIIYINTFYDSIQIYVIVFKLLNSDKNILVNYYEIRINNNYNIRIYKDITTFSFNGLLGIGTTNHNFDIDNERTFSNYFIIGNISFEYDIKINISHKINIFDEDNEYKISVREIIEKVNINNNIFGYLVDGIKIVSLLDESKSGFYIFSNKTKNKINQYGFISQDDIIIFKMISEIGVKLDNYTIDYEIIIKEPEFEDFISYADFVEYFPYNDSLDNKEIYKQFFIPKIFSVKKSYITFSVNECYRKCGTCSYLGDDIYHHCDICLKDYPISVPIKNGNNCIRENPQIEIENKCKDNFYINENSDIICLDGELCIDEYPSFDKAIKNMCTNCIVKYKGKCYLECPMNTCIKQDYYLDICVDINNGTKAINLICFDNFQDITSNIKNMSDNNIIINSIPNLKIYAYEINKDSNYFEENNLTYIFFKDIKDILIDCYHLNNDTNIYALLVDSVSKYSNSTINDYGFILLLENGTELNLSYLNNDIKVNISMPIVKLDLAKINYTTIFSEQGYDIYDKNSKFYHDICTPGYLDDNDLTIKDRQNEIYINNITIGKKNCEYQFTDLVNKRFIYNCYLIMINENNTNNNEQYYFRDKNDDELKNYILDTINYKIISCSSLFLNLDNYRHNKAVMISSACIFISILLLIIFFCKSFSKIRIIMYNELPSDKKLRQLLIENQRKNKILNNSNPLKKNLFINIDTNNNKKKSSKAQNIKMNMKYEEIYAIKKTNFSNSQKFQIDVFKELENIHKNDKNEKNRKNQNNLNQIFDKNKIKSKEFIENKEDYIEYDDLPFKMALKLEKRNIFYIFRKKITEKIKIFDIFANRKIKEIILSEYILYLLIDLTFNALLYSDNIVSHKSHNNGKLDFIIVILLTFFSNIFASIIGYYLEKLIDFEEKIYQIKDIKIEKEFLRVLNIILKEVCVRVIIFFLIEIIIIIFCTYYLFIFFTIYHKSQMSLLKNYLISLLEGWLINLIVTILIVSFRKFGILYNNKYSYNISKYLDKTF